MSHQEHNQNDRVEKLELSAAFTERHIEVLSEEIAQLNKAMATMVRRLERLESRLIEINDKVGETPPMVPPPHSAGPDVSRDPL
jgi:uncharacterized coiled-coil protein SlyX